MLDESNKNAIFTHQVQLIGDGEQKFTKIEGK